MSEFPPVPTNSPTPAEAGRTSGFAITAMVLGIASIFPGCCAGEYGTLILGSGAIVFAVMARRQITTGGRRGWGMALAGIITGVIGILLGLVMLVITLAVPDLQQRLINWEKQLQQQRQGNPLPGAPANPSTAPTESATSAPAEHAAIQSEKLVADWMNDRDSIDKLDGEQIYFSGQIIATKNGEVGGGAAELKGDGVNGVNCSFTSAPDDDKEFKALKVGQVVTIVGKYDKILGEYIGPGPRVIFCRIAK